MKPEEDIPAGNNSAFLQYLPLEEQRTKHHDPKTPHLQAAPQEHPPKSLPQPDSPNNSSPRAAATELSQISGQHAEENQERGRTALKQQITNWGSLAVVPQAYEPSLQQEICTEISNVMIFIRGGARQQPQALLQRCRRACWGDRPLNLTQDCKLPEFPGSSRTQRKLG